MSDPVRPAPIDRQFVVAEHVGRLLTYALKAIESEGWTDLESAILEAKRLAILRK